MSAQEAVCGLLETALNGYLGLDPQALGLLAPLHGRLIRLHIQGPELDLYLVPGPAGLQVFPDYEGEADCTLSGTPLGFARLGSGRAFQSGVEIQGDIEVGQPFIAVLADLAIDWEAQLARLTGDSLARQIGDGVRAGERWTRRTGQDLTADVQAYLQEGARLLPTRLEVAAFTAGVERLRDDLDGLEARLARLAKAPKGADRIDPGAPGL